MPSGLRDGPIERLGVAVSGGPDSLAMLLLAHAAFPDEIRAGDRRSWPAPRKRGGGGLGRRTCAARSASPHAVLGSAERSQRETGRACRPRRGRCAIGCSPTWARAEAAPSRHRPPCRRSGRDDPDAPCARLRPARPRGHPACRPLRRGGDGIRGADPALAWAGGARSWLAIVAAAGSPQSTIRAIARRAMTGAASATLLATPDAPAPERLAAAASHLADCEAALAWAADAAWSLRAIEGESWNWRSRRPAARDPPAARQARDRNLPCPGGRAVAGGRPGPLAGDAGGRRPRNPGRGARQRWRELALPPRPAAPSLEKLTIAIAPSADKRPDGEEPENRPHNVRKARCRHVEAAAQAATDAVIVRPAHVGDQRRADRQSQDDLAPRLNMGRHQAP